MCSVYCCIKLRPNLSYIQQYTLNSMPGLYVQFPKHLSGKKKTYGIQFINKQQYIPDNLQPGGYSRHVPSRRGEAGSSEEDPVRIPVCSSASRKPLFLLILIYLMSGTGGPFQGRSHYKYLRYYSFTSIHVLYQVCTRCIVHLYLVFI